jgi:hypothetical protein
MVEVSLSRSSQVAAVLSSAVNAAVLDSSRSLGTRIYELVSTSDMWWVQGFASDVPTATRGAGSAFLPAGVVAKLDGALGDTISVIRDSSDGVCVITQVMVVR